jgi:hypothetical protein
LWIHESSAGNAIATVEIVEWFGTNVHLIFTQELVRCRSRVEIKTMENLNTTQTSQKGRKFTLPAMVHTSLGFLRWLEPASVDGQAVDLAERPSSASVA